ncbi:MAG TPA: hypothetical protein VEP70_05360, partial [Burkholderiales bacterium]|nr:hypothetical protein [Burkholderiales bacterium]
ARVEGALDRPLPVLQGKADLLNREEERSKKNRRSRNAGTPKGATEEIVLPAAVAHEAAKAGFEIVGDGVPEMVGNLVALHQLVQGQRGPQSKTCKTQGLKRDDCDFHGLSPTSGEQFVSLPYLEQEAGQADSQTLRLEN